MFGLGDEAGQGVQVDGGVAEPVGGSLPGEVQRRGSGSHQWTFSETLAGVAPETWGGETVTAD